jgi:hypothetical protein
VSTGVLIVANTPHIAGIGSVAIELRVSMQVIEVLILVKYEVVDYLVATY